MDNNLHSLKNLHSICLSQTNSIHFILNSQGKKLNNQYRLLFCIKEQTFILAALVSFKSVTYFLIEKLKMQSEKSYWCGITPLHVLCGEWVYVMLPYAFLINNPACIGHYSMSTAFFQNHLSKENSRWRTVFRVPELWFCCTIIDFFRVQPSCFPRMQNMDFYIKPFLI